MCDAAATLLEYFLLRRRRWNKGHPSRLCPKDGLGAEQRGANMTASEITNAEEQKGARRHKIARQLYEGLVAQSPNRAITLCDGAGKVIARHDPLPEHEAPEIAP
jgi:hypothetical protein